MDVKKKYAKVVKKFDEKDYDAALKILHKMKANDRDYYYLESAIFHKLKEYVKEYCAFEKVSSMMSRSSPEDKRIYEDFFSKRAECFSQLGLVEECVWSCQHIIDNTKDKNIFCNFISNLLFILNAKEDVSADEFHAVYDKFRSFFTFEPFPRKFYDHDKIRVGFLSGDFYNHVVMRFAGDLLINLNRNSFAVYCYSNTAEKYQDEITKELRPKVDGWRDIQNLTDEAAANLIRDDEIDILFDLSNHTDYNRLEVMAYRPASVQMSGIGFTSSTGLKTVDYFFTDVYCIGNSAPYFTEKLLVLPHSHFCINLPDEIPGSATEPPCLKNGYITFGCFNQYRKITDSILIAWKNILDAVPNSRLIIKNKICSLKGSKEFIGNRLKQFGFNLNRVELRDFSDKHPLDYDDIDIALDTFPYTGVTTTCEAIYMGVPVVSLYSDRHSTRCGLSILKGIGLDELAVDSYEDYVNRAILLANDRELITILKKNLRIMLKKSPVMDTAGYVREMEQAFIEVFEAERDMFVAPTPQALRKFPKH